MWNRVSDSLAADRHGEGASERPASLPVPSRIGLMHWRVKLSLAACLLLALGLGGLKLREGQQDARQQALSSNDSLARFAFTPEELHENEVLVSEIQQLCLKPILVRKTSSGWDINEVPSLDNADASRKTAMVIRCLLMESTSPVNSPNDSWRVVDQEEVITDTEYQHIAANDQPGDIEAWVHLLPDQSLWTECHDGAREAVCVLKQNEPSIVWEERSNDLGVRRFVVVYQCLDIDDV
ncbi:hypothetical protein SH139x_004710 [Planctomycetaceae bacterium SH139]